MPRQHERYRRRKVHMSIREDILAGVETIFYDSVRDQVRYGALSTLTNGLLLKWLRDPSIYPLTGEMLDKNLVRDVPIHLQQQVTHV